MGAWDFIMAIGDDWTDEDLFEALPPESYSIKVGFGVSKAKFNISSPQEVRRLLKKMIQCKMSQKPGEATG